MNCFCSPTLSPHALTPTLTHLYLTHHPPPQDSRPAPTHTSASVNNNVDFVEVGQGQAEGVYTMRACFPDPATSQKLAWINLLQVRGWI